MTSSAYLGIEHAQGEKGCGDGRSMLAGQSHARVAAGASVRHRSAAGTSIALAFASHPRLRVIRNTCAGAIEMRLIALATVQWLRRSRPISPLS